MKVICPAIYKQKKQEMKTTSNLPDYTQKSMEKRRKVSIGSILSFHGWNFTFLFLSNASSYVSTLQNKGKETFKPRNIEFNYRQQLHY